MALALIAVSFVSVKNKLFYFCLFADDYIINEPNTQHWILAGLQWLPVKQSTKKKLINWLISGSEKVSALFQFLLQYFIIYLLCIHYILVGVGRKYSTILFIPVIWRSYYHTPVIFAKKNSSKNISFGKC